MAYVYRHVRLDKNEPFYIGIGSDDKYQRAFVKHERNNLWNKIVLKSKYIVEIVFEHPDYEVIKEKEKEFIKLYGRINKKTGILTNLTDGGDGCLGLIVSEKNKKKHSLRMSGTNNPMYGKKVLRAKGLKKPAMVGLLSGEKNPMYGKTHTEEARIKISKNRKKDRFGLNNPMFGKKRPELAEMNKRLKSKKVIDTSTSVVYNSILESHKQTNYSISYYKLMLGGKVKNKTSFKLLENG